MGIHHSADVSALKVNHIPKTFAPHTFGGEQKIYDVDEKIR